jgi:hypothetical protein
MPRVWRSGRTAADNNEAKPRNHHNDPGNHWNGNTVIFMCRHVERASIKYRFSFRIREMPKKKSADAQQYEHNAKKSQTTHDFPNPEQAAIIR